LRISLEDKKSIIIATNKKRMTTILERIKTETMRTLKIIMKRTMKMLKRITPTATIQ
jgi:hypothetical protein